MTRRSLLERLAGLPGVGALFLAAMPLTPEERALPARRAWRESLSLDQRHCEHTFHVVTLRCGKCGLTRAEYADRA